MTGGCCVFKFLRGSVDGKHLMRFQSEIAVFKFPPDVMSTGLSSKKVSSFQSLSAYQQDLGSRTLSLSSKSWILVWLIFKGSIEYEDNG